jgi:serine/threonine-protein kinase HipA
MNSRKAWVYNNGELAGVLEETLQGYVFTYNRDYLLRESAPAVSLTLPKQTEPFVAATLFPFFFGLLAEGVNKDVQCRMLKIDGNDHFGRLLITAGSDTIGAITVKPATDD